MELPKISDIVCSLALTTVVPLIVVAALIWHTCCTYMKLYDVPGPSWARLTNFQRLYWVKTGRAQEYHQQMHEKYGPCVRLGPNMVSISDPAVIPLLYQMRAGIPKSKFYQAFMPYTPSGLIPSIFTTQDEATHKQMKSHIAPLYSLSQTVLFEETFNELLQKLLNELDVRFGDTGVKFDLGDWLRYFAFDVMGMMTFSKEYGFLENGADVKGILADLRDFNLVAAPMTQVPWLDRLLHKNALANALRRQVVSPLLDFVNATVMDRQHTVHGQGPVHRRDFLSHYIDVQAKDSTIPPSYVSSWALSNVIAGSDTTAVAMRVLMFNLLSHPESLERLSQELKDTIESTGLTTPFPTWKELKDLPYLDACVNEALRLQPPVCLPFERVAPRGGITLCGRHFKDGTILGMNPYVVHRHRPTFGQDADKWRPERWLLDGANHRRMLDESLLSFGAGRRICLGKQLALFELKKIVPALLLNYEIKLLDPSTFATKSSWILMQSGLETVIKRRTTKP